MKLLRITAALTLATAAGPLPAQAIPVTSGDAVAGLVSTGAKAEVHLITDRSLLNKRLVLKVVVLNRSAAPAAFGPADVTVAAPDGTPIAQATRQALLGRSSGGAAGAYETSEAHAAAALPTSPNGQMDVSNYTGGMSTGMAGVPSSQLDRTQQGAADGAAAAKLDAVLLKQGVIGPNQADGGQVITDVIKRGKIPNVTVDVTFAGEVHRFQVAVPH